MGNSISSRATPKHRTGAAVVVQKLERAAKTGNLSLQQSKLVAVPLKVWSLASLRTLDLSHNRLGTLPPQLATFLQLKSLRITNNVLTSLPPLVELAKLETLDLDHNQLTDLPPLPLKLKRLSATANAFVGTPMAIYACPKLADVDLSENASMGAWQMPRPVDAPLLNALRRLCLDACGLRSLPAEMGAFRQMQNLSLRGNALSAVPSALLTDTTLNQLRLDGSPMTRASFEAIPGADAFMERMKARVDKDLHVSGGGEHLCGLSS